MSSFASKMYQETMQELAREIEKELHTIFPGIYKGIKNAMKQGSPYYRVTINKYPQAVSERLRNEGFQVSMENITPHPADDDGVDKTSFEIKWPRE